METTEQPLLNSLSQQNEGLSEQIIDATTNN